jgi:nicotinamide-nucleotide adenylyltransferase
LFELLYVSHDLWPFSRGSKTDESGVPEGGDGIGKDKGREEVRMAIMDSSYNPPTLAHEEMAASLFPPSSSALLNTSSTSTSTSTSTLTSVSASSSAQPSERYTARLLLLSPSNVDKTLKPGDATLAQRIEMMILLAQDIQDRQGHLDDQASSSEQSSDGSLGNIAVGVLNFATFVGKSVILHDWMRGRWDDLVTVGKHEDGLGKDLRAITTDEPSPANARDSSHPEKELGLHLSFIIGSDTLTRLFVEKYYPPSAVFPQIGSNMSEQLDHFFNNDGSSIVSFPRHTSKEDEEKEHEYVRGNEYCRPLVRDGKIRLIQGNLGGKLTLDQMSGISSTLIRKAVKGEGNIDQLCGERMKGYIAEEGLYRE